MFKRLLVTTDGSEFSLHAVRVAAALARRLSATLTIVTVTEDPQSDEAERLEKRYAKQAAEALHAARAAASELGIAAGTEHVTRSNRVAGIVRAAERIGCDLIVIGSHGAGGFERLIVGSTAKRLLANTQLPVLVVRGEHELPKASGTITVAVDGSEQALRAAHVATSLARVLEATLRIATVMPEPTQPGLAATYWGMPMPAYLTEEQRRDYVASMTAEAEKLLTPVLGAAGAVGVSAERRMVFADHPTDGILDAAQGGDLIVMGSHGRRGLAYMALGSVATEIVTRSTQPVLIVK